MIIRQEKCQCLTPSLTVCCYCVCEWDFLKKTTNNSSTPQQSNPLNNKKHHSNKFQYVQL